MYKFSVQFSKVFTILMNLSIYITSFIYFIYIEGEWCLDEKISNLPGEAGTLWVCTVCVYDLHGIIFIFSKNSFYRRNDFCDFITASLLLNNLDITIAQWYMGFSSGFFFFFFIEINKPLQQRLLALDIKSYNKIVED